LPWERAIVVPGEGRVYILTEVYDSKEFTGTFKVREEKCGASYLQNLTEYGESPTFFRSIESKKPMARRRAYCSAFDIVLRETRTTETFDKKDAKAYRFRKLKLRSLTLT